MLWGIKNQYGLNLRDAEHISVATINRRSDNRPVYVDASMEDLIDKALNQNFVPVVDDQENFIGIITRKDIIRYCYDMMCKEKVLGTRAMYGRMIGRGEPELCMGQ